MSPNPYGNLAGFSDPSEPGWQERLMAQVEAKQAQSQERRRERPHPLRDTQLHIYTSAKWLALLRVAAEMRNISMVAYARRATSAFMAIDLGMDLSEVLALTPKPHPFLGKQPIRPPVIPDDGEDHGPWRIADLA